MATYFVKWEMDVDAETPEEAARLCREMLMDPNNEASCFYVTNMSTKESEMVDVLEL